ncbi:hypothetical protein ACQZ6A_18110 [Agrobacterium vitis]
MALQNWISYESTVIYRIGASAYTYKSSHVSLDADGCPRAYHPDDIGLDYNANAGYPNKGWRSVLVVDPDEPSKPYLQTSGPNRGFFVSKTSLHNPDYAVTANNPAKYVDAETVPYIVFPGAFYSITGTGGWGDFVMARTLNGAHESFAIVADGGPTKAPLGEISLKLAAALGGINPNPKTGKGAPKGPIQYVVFPNSRLKPAWPHALHDLRAQAETLLAGIGGWPDSEMV